MQEKNNSQDFISDTMLIKNSLNGWAFLHKYLSVEEFAVAFSLGLKADDNSLRPFNNKTPNIKLAKVFGVSRIVLKKMFAKLSALGVYGQFEVADKFSPYTKYWLLSPYLMFSGETKNSSIKFLFDNTHVHNAFLDPNYELTEQQIIDLKIKSSTLKRRKAK